MRKTKGAPGFTKLRNRYIVKVDNRAANVVYLTCMNGDRYAVEADVTSLGIPVLRLTQAASKEKLDTVVSQFALGYPNGNTVTVHMIGNKLVKWFDKRDDGRKEGSVKDGKSFSTPVTGPQGQRWFIYL